MQSSGRWGKIQLSQTGCSILFPLFYQGGKQNLLQTTYSKSICHSALHVQPAQSFQLAVSVASSLSLFSWFQDPGMSKANDIETAAIGFVGLHAQCFFFSLRAWLRALESPIIHLFANDWNAWTKLNIRTIQTLQIRFEYSQSWTSGTLRKKSGIGDLEYTNLPVSFYVESGIPDFFGVSLTFEWRSSEIRAKNWRSNALKYVCHISMGVHLSPSVTAQHESATCLLSIMANSYRIFLILEWSSAGKLGEFPFFA